ncbi:unnamed protein product [Vicia faba]|uniref:F-box domain-containing protein n=1 Tax=Vicia faba TaxID=3906 RepID=A0AAV0ZIC2_VICFA|nr:unnamed protein product [Vicia faba]
MSDLISDLPNSIIETILIQVPIIDATRTTILSPRWRDIWRSINHLVFDEKSFPVYVNYDDRLVFHERIVKFISTVLSLHEGPIHKFQISHRSLLGLPEIDDWILFLSRNGGVKDLTLDLGVHQFFIIPSCLFDCEKLTRLELSRCELYLPDSFKGFSCLKRLNLTQALVSSQAIERLVSTCPLLESLSLIRCDCLALTISAPNLKYMQLFGEFIDIRLVDMPLLVELFVSMYMPDDDLWEQSSNCNFVKFLSGVPNLKKLDGFVHFTKYLSIGNELRHLAMMFNNLECIQLRPVCFTDTKEILVVLGLIRCSPNLKELQISGMSDIRVSTYAQDLDIWERECPSDSILSKLKAVDLEEMSGVPHEIQFIKFLLGSSPVLEKMFIIPYINNKEYLLKMTVELMKFRRASTKAEVYFTRLEYPIRVSSGF